jgi:hypothetical protein
MPARADGARSLRVSPAAAVRTTDARGQTLTRAPVCRCGGIASWTNRFVRKTVLFMSYVATNDLRAYDSVKRECVSA